MPFANYRINHLLFLKAMQGFMSSDGLHKAEKMLESHLLWFYVSFCLKVFEITIKFNKNFVIIVGQAITTYYLDIESKIKADNSIRALLNPTILELIKTY